MSDAISAHGTVITRGGVTIQEVQNIELPQMLRATHDVTTHGNDDERVKVGIRQYGDLTFDVGFIPGNSNHVGLINAWKNATVDEYGITTPDGFLQVFNGYITQIIPQAPVDGLLTAKITVRPTGSVSFTGVTLSEDSDFITTEAGNRIAWE